MIQVTLEGHRVLIVEDMYMIALNIQHLLEDAGYDVAGPVPDVNRALDIIRTTEIDGALLDINVKGGDSFPIADELMERNIPFLFLSGNDRETSIPEKYRHCRCVRKPFAEEALVSTVGELLQQGH